MSAELIGWSVATVSAAITVAYWFGRGGPALGFVGLYGMFVGVLYAITGP